MRFFIVIYCPIIYIWGSVLIPELEDTILIAISEKPDNYWGIVIIKYPVGSSWSAILKLIVNIDYLLIFNVVAVI